MREQYILQPTESSPGTVIPAPKEWQSGVETLELLALWSVLCTYTISFLNAFIFITIWLNTNRKHVCWLCGVPGAGETPILEGGRAVPHDWPPILTFSDPVGSSLYGSTRSHWPKLSAENNRFVSIPVSSKDKCT